MNEEEIRAEIKRRKDVFAHEQAALSFAEKVRIAFALNERQQVLKRARLIRREGSVLPSPTGGAGRRPDRKELPADEKSA